jgi:bacteriocin biosynthesis cyclodehydratase domain-containing protein
VPLDESSIIRLNAGLVALGAAGRTFLGLEPNRYLIENPIVGQLLQILQTPCTVGSVLQELCPPHDIAAVRSILEELYSARILCHAGSHFKSRSSAAFWDMFSGTESAKRRTVAVDSLLPQFAKPVEDLLQANGVEVNPEADLGLLITDDYLRPEMSEYSRRRPEILPVKAVGRELWIGPLLSQPSKLCWECLAYWLRLHRWPELAIAGASDWKFYSTSIPSIPSTLTLASGLIATVASLAAAGALTSNQGRLQIFDTQTLRSTRRRVSARRNCPVCSPVDSKRVFLSAMQSSVTGILEDLRCSDSVLDFSFLAHARVMLPLPEKKDRDVLRPLSADGKGPTREEAIRRCTMEGIERFSCVYAGNESLIRARLDEVNGIAPNEIALYSEDQFRNREHNNARAAGTERVPEPFDPNASMEWALAHSLTTGLPRHVPAGNVFLGYPFAGEPQYACTNTNGCAAGLSRNGALLRALLELVERDAVAIWWYNKLRRPAVDLDAWNDPGVTRLRERMTRQGRSLELLDLTHDLRIPVYACICASAGGQHVLFGAAASLCGATAARKAIAEVLQFWYWIARLGPNAEQRAWLERSSLREFDYLAPMDWSAPLPQRLELTDEDALRRCVRTIADAGLEPYAVDLTRPEFGIPVTRVIVPGLRHYAPRFAAGRLYEVPVCMGWRAVPLREADLNQQACVL